MSQKGTPHFVTQRFTAVIMVVTVTWFLIALITHISDTRAELTEWLTAPLGGLPIPVSSIILAVLLVAVFVHMRIGMNEIIDDYIHKPSTKSMLTFLNTLFALVMGGISLAAIVALNLG